jgi:hypothetical protein
MKTFLIKISVAYIGSIIIILGLFHMADGNTDAFYLRFTTSTQNSLIIGSSRAAQGIVSEVLNSELEKNGYRGNIYNYGFALGYSSYGPAYLESIKKKLDPSSKNGIFILEVNPWTISSRSETPDDSTSFVENTLPVGVIEDVNKSPNFQYLLDFYDQGYLMILVNKVKNMNLIKPYLNTSYLHDDGWFEVSVKMDEASVKSRYNKTINEYVASAPKVYNYSSVRYNYLKKTIELLSKHGKVFLVRLPIHEKIFEAENSYMPDFSSKMSSVSEEFGVGYLDLTEYNDDVQYTDANHLWKESGRRMSELIAKNITEHITNK